MRQPSSLIQPLRDAMGTLILGKPEEITLALTCFLAEGHLLLNDLPGMGKTTLARSLAKTLGLDFQRIQCTSDLMPADILGVSVFHQQQQSFEFHPGPVFTQILLADEINRAPPRTQSALLEAMEESQVTVDRHTHPLPQPFFVIATQNPVDLVGTFPLPDAQLDRFLFRVSLGYPSPEVELSLMKQGGGGPGSDDSTALLTLEETMALRSAASAVSVSDKMLAYMLRLIMATREHPAIRVGLSPRASVLLVKASKAYALIQGRSHVHPEDIQAVFKPLANHRLVMRSVDEQQREAVLNDVLAQTPVAI